MLYFVLYVIIALIVFIAFTYIGKVKGEPLDEVLIAFDALFSLFWIVFVPIFLVVGLFYLLAKVIRRDS